MSIYSIPFLTKGVRAPVRHHRRRHRREVLAQEHRYDLQAVRYFSICEVPYMTSAQKGKGVRKCSKLVDQKYKFS